MTIYNNIIHNIIILKYFYTVLKIVTAMSSFMSTQPPFQLPWTACQTSLSYISIIQ